MHVSPSPPPEATEFKSPTWLTELTQPSCTFIRHIVSNRTRSPPPAAAASPSVMSITRPTVTTPLSSPTAK